MDVRGIFDGTCVEIGVRRANAHGFYLFDTTHFFDDRGECFNRSTYIILYLVVGLSLDGRCCEDESALVYDAENGVGAS